VLLQRNSNDDATDRRLRLLVGLVVVSALFCTGAWCWWATHNVRTMPPLWAPALLVAGFVIANRVKVYVRVRSNLDIVYWGEAPVLFGLVLLPAPWVVLCGALTMAVIKVVTRSPRQKAAFAVAKDVLTTSAAAGVFLAWGVHPDLNQPPFHVLAIVTAYLAMTAVDDLAYWPVMAVASGSTIRKVAAHNWDVTLAGHAIRLATIVLALAILRYGDLLQLLVVPLLVACIHLWHARNVRTRQERKSWQDLARTTDELNAVDLTHVLHSGVTRSAQIFSADQARIDLNGDFPQRLVQGTGDGVTHDGSPAGVAGCNHDTDEVTDLVTSEGSVHIGVLRLCFRRRVNLTEFERYKLQTFASALSTAIQNATAYAELERISAENAYAATHDPLTGLANRRQLLDRADALFGPRSNAGLAALLLIDLNHFKEVNDTLGHSTGDEVLREVAVRLQAAAEPDDLVARLGGDEFAVLLTGLPTPAIATHRAESLLSTLDRSIEVDGMQLTVEASGGIALVAGSGGVTELLRRADVAMYQAKRSGQRTVNYVHSTDTADVGRLMLGGALKRAVAQQQFFVDFQPIVELGTGEVVSAEALARWHHPEHGNITSMQFLETVERSGQLPAFADAVLEQSFTAVRTWREAGFDLPVAVDVSPRSLLDPAFPGTILSRLSRHGVEPDRLVLELTETLTISQLEVVERSLRELRDAGVRLALDDFGTGFSSLSVLSRLPVHQLKIGREFVVAVETSVEAAAVIRSTVDLARSRHLTVVADGVESEPQRHALWELGCVAGQGHLFARPMGAERMLAALQRGSGGRPGVLAGALHDAGSVVRLPRRRPAGNGRSSLPHLPA
jgi:diguanylate cyclase (GGDEF)-like protein